MAVLEECGPDAERQEVKRDEQELEQFSSRSRRRPCAEPREKEERDHQRVRV